MPELTVKELLGDLGLDTEHAGAVGNLEALYLQPLEHLTDDPAIIDRVMEVRRCLAQTHLALRKLAAMKDSK